MSEHLSSPISQKALLLSEQTWESSAARHLSLRHPSLGSLLTLRSERLGGGCIGITGSAGRKCSVSETQSLLCGLSTVVSKPLFCPRSSTMSDNRLLRRSASRAASTSSTRARALACVNLKPPASVRSHQRRAHRKVASELWLCLYFLWRFKDDLLLAPTFFPGGCLHRRPRSLFALRLLEFPINP